MPGFDDSITGVTLCDETIRQYTSGGDALAAVLVNAGIVPASTWTSAPNRGPLTPESK